MQALAKEAREIWKFNALYRKNCTRLYKVALENAELYYKEVLMKERNQEVQDEFLRFHAR